MLEMGEERISFADALRPVGEFKLVYAVGTTYSLDLRALLGLCIPIGLGFEPEALATINPVSLFVALKKLQSKLAIYCDKGSIKADVPKNPRSAGLLMLLEGMIHQVHVNARRVDELSSFHPKVWVAEYEGPAGEHLYRLLVMSRNLTFDTSWDVVVALDGHPGQPNDCSEHVAQFLEFLAEGDARITTERDDTRRKDSHTARIRKLAQDVRGVEFQVDGKEFEAVDFLPFGPGDSNDRSLMDAQRSPLVDARYKQLLVVSPFLSDGASSPLVRLQQRRSGTQGRFVLLSREDSLARLDPSVRDAYETFCPVPTLADVELDGEGDASATGYSDLHAKLYFCEEPDARRHLYLGSLNASYNGTVNNVEAMLRLDVRSGYLTFPSVLKPLIGEGGKEPAPFSPFVAPSEVEEGDAAERAFSKAFYIASRLLSFRSVVVQVGDDEGVTLAVVLDVASAKKKCAGVSLSLRPLLTGEAMAVPVALDNRRQTLALSFEGLKPEEVSGLFVLTGSDGEGHESSTVIVCPHDRFDDASLSLERRSSLLLKSIVEHSKGALTQYLEHAFNLPEASYALSDKEGAARGVASRATVVPHGLYERLLDMADADPSAFQNARYLLGLLPDDVDERGIEDLKRLVGVFMQAVK